jgi:hypothetical protein
MRVCVINFGTNWWAMRSPDRSDPYCFRRNAAYFNAAALMCGRRLHHSAIFPGQVRFNVKSGFDPEFPSRAIGRTFLCSGPNQVAGRVHLLFMRPVAATPPDAYLVTLNSIEHSSIRFDKPGWRSSGVQPISISLRGPRYEAMLLMGVTDWVWSELGKWMVDTARNRLELADCVNGVSQ